MGEWDNPYITLMPEYEAEQLRVFRDIYNNLRLIHHSAHYMGGRYDLLPN